MSAVSSQWRMPAMTAGPQRIVCLTEETTEWLYLLGQESRIVGISGYTVRPRRAREEKPKVSAFTSAKIDKIMELEPDCVIGFSDMQADVASALIRQGVQVTVFNQRSVGEIFAVLQQIAAMVGCETPSRRAHCACVSPRRLRAMAMFWPSSSICCSTACGYSVGDVFCLGIHK